MKIVFCLNVLSPHQLPLAREVVRLIGAENFKYVYAEEFHAERKAMGWDDGDMPVWCMKGDESSKELIEADLVYTGIRCLSLMARRSAMGKKTVYYSERWFKPWFGALRLMSLSYRRMARKFVRLMSGGGVVYLSSGIHAARDMARLCGLMHGDLRCLFRAPKLEFERKPGGRIWLKGQSSVAKAMEDERRYCLDKMRMWGYFVEEGRGKKEEGRRDVYRQRAQEKIDEWLDGVSEHWFVDVLDKLLDEKLATGEYKFKGSGGRVAMREGAIRFFRRFSRKIVQLSDGRCVYFTPDERAKRRNADNVVSWAEYAIHAVTNGGNYHEIAAFDVLEQTLLLERCVVRLNEDAHYDAIMFLGESILGSVVSVVTRLDDYGNIDANLTEVTFEASSKRRRKQPRLIPLAEAIEMVVHRQVAAGSNPSTAEIISNRGSGCKWSTPSSQLTTTNFSHFSTLRVLWVGRLLKLKRVDTIIRAVGELSRGGKFHSPTPTFNSNSLRISLDIYGAGPEEMRLKQMAAKYGDAIKFYPPVPIDEVRKLMQEHDVYVFGSNGYEGWGAVVSEALEEGMKVIGTYEAGASATILPKERLFHAGDWRTLSRLLEQESKGQLPPCSIGDWTAKEAAKQLLEFA